MRHAWKEPDPNRMRDESRATFVLVEEDEELADEELADEELAIIPFLLPDPPPRRLNLHRHAPGISIALLLAALAAGFLLGASAPLWASGRLDDATSWIDKKVSTEQWQFPVGMQLFNLTQPAI